MQRLQTGCECMSEERLGFLGEGQSGGGRLGPEGTVRGGLLEHTSVSASAFRDLEQDLESRL